MAEQVQIVQAVQTVAVFTRLFVQYLFDNPPPRSRGRTRWGLNGWNNWNVERLLFHGRAGTGSHHHVFLLDEKFARLRRPTRHVFGCLRAQPIALAASACVMPSR